jgi:cell division protein FtsI (penicillin-binding protein 3)
LLQNYYGTKDDVNSILSWVKIPSIDSGTGNWRSMAVSNSKAVLSRPQQSFQQAAVTPDVVGMGLKDAIELLENKGVKVAVSGRGRVFSQSPAGGTALRKGQTVNLVLN